MLPFGVTVPAAVPQRSDIPEGLMNYPEAWWSSYSCQMLKKSELSPQIFE
jgi:hypothetical protein